VVLAAQSFFGFDLYTVPRGLDGYAVDTITGSFGCTSTWVIMLLVGSQMEFC
jgi:hypothetical protein